jgi:acetate kinase
VKQMEDDCMTDTILALKAGSSSFKFSLFDTSKGADTFPLLYQGVVDGIGSKSHFIANGTTGQRLVDEQLKAKASADTDHESALGVLLDWIEQHETGLTLAGVGQRVVRGGTLYSAPVLVDAQVINQLDSFIPLAPLHQPNNLTAIKSIASIKPDIPQVACFDTAFHHTQPPIAQAFALPRSVTERMDVLSLLILGTEPACVLGKIAKVLLPQWALHLLTVCLWARAVAQSIRVSSSTYGVHYIWMLQV